MLCIVFVLFVILPHPKSVLLNPRSCSARRQRHIGTSLRRSCGDNCSRFLCIVVSDESTLRPGINLRLFVLAGQFLVHKNTTGGGGERLAVDFGNPLF